MSLQKLTWLHLSDLHAQAATEWDSRELVEKITSDLTELQKEGLRPDILIFSGDAAFGSTPEQKIEDQYIQVACFFDAVRQAFQPAIPLDRIFVVPGNHDVDRNLVSDIDTEWLRNPARKEEEIIKEIRGNTLEFKRWMERFTGYRNFLKDYGLIHLQPEDPYLHWTNTIEVHGFRIGIAGLNSAWSCASKDEKGRLWMGGRWQLSQLEKQLKNVDFSIGVVHHPSNWLNGIEDPHFGRELRSKFNLVLHGHEHLEAVSQDEDGNILVSAGACYQWSTMPNGYNIGQIRLDGSGGEIYLRTWDSIGKGWIARNIAKKAPQGVWLLKEVKSLAERGKHLEIAKGQKTSAILNITAQASEEAIQKRLKSLRKRPLNFETQHSRVRLAERSVLEQFLSEDRFAWLVSDWQMGKDGFISSTLNNLGSNIALENVYRIDCGQAITPEDIIDAAGTQLGISFVEFAEVVRRAEQPTLILDDIPVGLIKNHGLLDDFQRKIQDVIDFSPNLRILLICRQWPQGATSKNVLHLTALGLPETSLFLKSHPMSASLGNRPDLLERIHVHTGGLPSAIDRLIDQTRFVSIETLLDEFPDTEFALPERIPQTLKDAVASVFNPQNEKEVRSLLLFKLLAVLKDGETFESLKYFYHKKPFYIENVVHLADLALIESVEIAQTGRELIPKRRYEKIVRTEAPKLLRVPRQIRDYVMTLILPEERSQIFGIASEALFGGRWYEGRISLRRSIITAYKQSSLSGPGNELLVAQYLLQTALASRRSDRIDRFSKLAVGYCAELVSQDRFRDAVIAGGAILKMLDEKKQSKNWLNCAYNYAHALRMNGQHELALEHLNKILDDAEIDSTELRGKVLLEIAWAHEALREIAPALLYAKKAVEVTEKESDTWFQGNALIAEHTLKGEELEIALAQLADKARNLKLLIAANNISLTLSTISRSKKNTLKYLNLVLSSAKDMYNRSRAISRKAAQLQKEDRILELTPEEQTALCVAYEYGYGQRISHLIDSCHSSIWNLCKKANFWVSLFRIYRYSSFVWAMSNHRKKEKEYRDLLLEITEKSSDFRRELVEVEVVYLEGRLTENLDEE